jgi:adenylate cyclase
MNTQDFKRKLTAVFSADVAGYSRLMGEDEATTVKTLEAYKQVMFSLIKQHRGRVIDSPGDNLLAEFASVVDAVQCGVAVQNELKARNADLPENRRMQFRIGINLGDVIDEGDRIYGDGVNIAARLESLADPGGICVSKTAFDQIETKLPLGYRYIGEQSVKNIAKGVGAYKVLMEPRVIGARGKAPNVRPWRSKPVLAVSIVVLILLVGVAVWNFYWRAPKVELVSVSKMTFPLPAKPSIAVLPFANMSDDPQQEYFSDGMTEDLITDLSKISGLFVIARNSTFVYKGKPVKIQQVAEDLGVRYVLEGSVRRAGDQLRINAQLVDATTGQHLWAERYDGIMKDIFSLQDKINQKITAALAVKLTAGEKSLVTQKGTHDPAAYEEYLRGREHYLRTTKEDFVKAEACYKRAIDLDPNYSQAKASLALLYFDVARQNRIIMDALKIDYVEACLRARQYLMEAMKEPTSTSYQLAGLMGVTLRQWDEGISQFEKALALGQNDPACHNAMSWALSNSGRPAEGMEHAKMAMQLDPLNPARYLTRIGFAHFCMGEWQEAVTAIEKGLKLNPMAQAGSPGVLAAAYSHLGRNEEATAPFQAFMQHTMGGIPMYFWPFKDQRVEDSFVEGVIKAGFSRGKFVSIHVSKEDQVTGDDLRAFYFPSTTTGYFSQGAEWTLEIAKDGTAILRSSVVPGGVDSGRSWMEGDKLWLQFQKHNHGIAYCSTTFKNPTGTPEGKNEYISFNDVWYTKFSRKQ